MANVPETKRLFDFIGALIEGLVALLSAALEALLGLFEVVAVAGESYTLLEGAALLPIAILEFFGWFALWIAELAAALFQRRKPTKVKRPIIWRPKTSQGAKPRIDDAPKNPSESDNDRSYLKRGDGKQRLLNVALVLMIIGCIYVLLAI